MKQEEKKITLSSGEEVIIRQPSIEADLNRLVGFFSSLPAEIKNNLVYKVSDPEICRERLNQVDGKDHWRFLAEIDGKIAGDATMDRSSVNWTRHVAHIRVVVHPDYWRLGVGTLLCNQLVSVGAQSGVERLDVEMLKQHKEFIEMVGKLGFKYEVTRKHYAKDVNGELHDMIIMSNDLEAVWKRLAEELMEMDTKPHSIGM